MQRISVRCKWPFQCGNTQLCPCWCWPAPENKTGTHSEDSVPTMHAHVAPLSPHTAAPRRVLHCTKIASRPQRMCRRQPNTPALHQPRHSYLKMESRALILTHACFETNGAHLNFIVSPTQTRPAQPSSAQPSPA